MPIILDTLHPVALSNTPIPHVGYSNFSNIPTEQKEDLPETESESNEESQSSFIWVVAKMGLETIALGAADSKLSNLISNIFSKNIGLCLGNFLSNGGIEFLRNVESPIAKFNNMLGRLFGQNLTGKVGIPALCEEVEFRWFVQEICMHKLPQKILEKIAPDLAHLVDSTPARITRVAAAAMIFALIHAHALQCKDGGGIPQLIGGLLYGAMYEYTNFSLAHTINAHYVYNVINNYFQ